MKSLKIKQCLSRTSRCRRERGRQWIPATGLATHTKATKRHQCRQTLSHSAPTLMPPPPPPVPSPPLTPGWSLLCSADTPSAGPCGVSPLPRPRARHRSQPRVSRVGSHRPLGSPLGHWLDGWTPESWKAGHRTAGRLDTGQLSRQDGWTADCLDGRLDG